MTDASRKFAADAWAGYEILVVDGSSVSRPGSEGTTARVHYVLRLSDLQPVEIQVTDDKGGETFRRYESMVCLGQLWMGDRGYANPPGIAAITSRGADVLVRYNRGSLPLYDVHGDLLNVREKLKRLRNPGRPRQWSAWVHPQSVDRIGGRICAVRLPPDKAEEARERLRREQGQKVTAESLEMASFVVI